MKKCSARIDGATASDHRLDKTQDLMEAAAGIIDDFENYGEVLQTDGVMEYGPTTNIKRLTRAYMAMAGPKPPQKQVSPGKYFKKVAKGSSDFAP